jgi:hypothetical protein
MEYLVTDVVTEEPLVTGDFHCLPCGFHCSRRGDWNRHLQTKKHKKGKEDNKMECPECGRFYFSRNGLWKHLKRCNRDQRCNRDLKTQRCNRDKTQTMNLDNEYEGINIKDKDALVMHLLKQNKELQDKIIELASETRNSFHTTNYNKHFNLNFFLNETCKDAMNITDFVDSIKVSIDDLENTGRQGYIQGISDIIINNLSKLEKHLRPLHCSDFKREILYIKDNNEWMKETDGNPILTKTIRTIANENIKQIHKWRELYPDCSRADSVKNDLYLKIVGNSMNGLTEEEGERNISKIISNVAKKVLITK